MSALAEQHESWLAARQRIEAAAARLRPIIVSDAPLPLPEPTPEPVQEDLGPDVQLRYPRPLVIVAAKHPSYWRQIVRQEAGRVSAETGVEVTFTDVLGPSRARHIILARHAACFRLYYECTRFSLPQIGRLLGGRDHTTIIHGARTHAARIGVVMLPRPKAPTA